jgi:hypothetical protein
MRRRYNELDNARLHLVSQSTRLRVLLADEAAVVSGAVHEAERVWRVARTMTRLLYAYHEMTKRPATHKSPRRPLLIAGAIGTALALAVATWTRASKQRS